MTNPRGLFRGNNIFILKSLPDNCIDSIVTDPPYELGFMGKSWDNSGIAYNVELWRECLRVLKPGGHLLAFGGSRTYHRLACAVEDAGFEVRDQIMWLYGSGFPKSLDVTKAIDKAAGAEREVVGTSDNGIAGGTGEHAGEGGKYRFRGEFDITAPATDAAKQWSGWGTALKPAHEPIVVARKPLVGTVANNVLTYGTGALNIDGCRIGTDGGTSDQPTGVGQRSNNVFGVYGACETTTVDGLGRWPANFIHDGSDEVLAGFPTTKSGLMRAGQKTRGYDGPSMGAWGPGVVRSDTYADEGSAARFFYCAKASRAERNAGLEGLDAVVRNDGRAEDLASGNMPHNRSNNPKQNHHPTVKPLALMRHLVRLVTPPGGVVLDPFLGSGTTAVAAVQEGFEWIGCELTPEYWPIIEARTKWAEQEKAKPTPAPKAKRSAPKKKTSGGQQTLFAE